MSLIEINELSKHYEIPMGPFKRPLLLKAVDQVSLSINRGETLGLVGESGCGKSTLGKCLLQLIPPSTADISYDGHQLIGLSRRALRPFRRKMQIVFQDPYASLNPRMTVGSILEEPLVIHKLCKGRAARRARVKELLELVGLPKDCDSRYPHEFSGGQRQRIGIARALAVEPEFILCDEPVSALDVSVQAQIVNQLVDLQEKLGLTYLFISHDLRIVQHLCHRVAVMYLGKIVEIGTSYDIYNNPKHPYTQALLSSVPNPDPTKRKGRTILPGEPPSPTKPPAGCTFHPRCPIAEERCRTTIPMLKPLVENPDHRVSCLIAENG